MFDSPSPHLTIGLQQSSSTVLLDVLSKQYDRLGFGVLDDTDFLYLCIARLVEPTSKLDSLRVLLDLGVNGIDKNRLYRCLQRVIADDYRSQLAVQCFLEAKRNGIALVLYDVTTLYFEVQQEDDYRKPGMSKERRLEPQIVLGLLVDQSGFPLELQSFEGNKAETKTILPIIEQFKARHNLTDITVVADAAMLSRDNLESLVHAGYNYIVGSRLSKVPYDIAEYQRQNDLVDNQIITTKTTIPGQRIIYQYRVKRALLDMRNIEKQILKAQKIVKGHIPARRAKFLKVTTKEKMLNQVLIDKARALVGIKGYVTNLTITDKQVISYYHELWQVERSFRMSKSDLKARPIFHRKKDAIEAHLTVVFAALAIGRTVEQLTGLSLRHVIKVLRPIRSGTVVIHGKEYQAEAIIPPAITPLLKRLQGTN
ncbi:MAG: IS1634 family transposase [bacterium]|nr:IS1634 family transposase [bacterium]